MGQLNSLVFPAPKSSYTSHDFENIIYIPNPTSKKKHNIPSVYIKSSQTSSKKTTENIILYFHGNAEDIGLTFDFVNEISSQLNISLIIPEYRGYGIHPGNPSEKSIIHDSEVVYTFIQKIMGIPEENIILFGRSLGTGPACHIASKFDPKALILMSPYTSIKAVASNLAGSFASSLLADRFKNIDKIDKVKCPKLLLHGKKDKLIPIKQSKELFAKAPTNTEFWYANEMTHNSFDLVFDILIPIDNFLKKYGMLTEEYEAK